MNTPTMPAISLLTLCLLASACHEDHAEHEGHAHRKIVVTSPLAKDVTITQQYVCQIRSQRHIEVCALASGFLMEIPIKEGQAVKQGDVLFNILPVLYKARMEAEKAEAQLAAIEYNNAKKLFEDKNKVVSDQDVALCQAKLAKAQAKLELAEAELGFTTVRAPFDGIVDRLLRQQGSRIQEEDVLTTLSDNAVMWVYFNVPEARYLDYMAGLQTGGTGADPQARLAVILEELNRVAKIELVLANGSRFAQVGKLGTIEANFNNETGNIAFRADFPNPDRLLRHGQTGNVLVHRVAKQAIVIPQRATFEILDKRYVYVVDADGTVHQRLITIQHELDDIFLIKSGIGVDDKIILEGGRQVHEGDKVEFEFRKPEEALSNQKNRAE